MVMSLPQRLFESPLPLDPLHLLVGLPFPGLGKNFNKLASYILLAAKRVIPMCWLASIPPSQEQLLNAIAKIHRMEHMTALIEGAIDRFDRVWDLWDKSE